MNNPLVSIIISAYNHEDYVLPCLESMINQTYKNIELILINDGSTDSTHEKILSYIDKLKDRFVNIKYINKENDGISTNFNLGIMNSNGYYIKTFASDDILINSAIEELVCFLETNKDYDIAYGDGYHVNSKKEKIESKDLKEEYRFSNIVSFKSGNIHEYLYDILPQFSTWTVLFKRSCFDELGYYDTNLYCEDMDLYLRFSKRYKFGYINKVLALHRIHGNNAGLDPNVMLTTFNRMFKKYDSTNFFEKEEYRIKFIKLISWTEKVLLNEDYSKLQNIDGKKVIIWGTGSLYQKKKISIPFNIHYFVDSNKDNQGKLLDGKRIYPIDKLLEEPKNEIFILVFSSFFEEIYVWLEKNGFSYKVNYY